mmetsp:Transcript_63793/g.101103  ORF Transcript_63793/g.101103 Transcript_63793/m.101103 type:complete len:140 (+) Transcript_63793:53-472(+)|eukprot:CAMPEP_0169117464 /NCGR_PEP_ID=MMETSP1015-20121227/30473_1 /TAXON_ID=342587 /ORGANISM="Karlodinium micrum, Strain CCMP2283" /LENGTH=139 /DNA_ID=CAMNT_0009180151 /DNA_START=53 /DNA_END=472 /DNA_ORIENTATION=+
MMHSRKKSDSNIASTSAGCMTRQASPSSNQSDEPSASIRNARQYKRDPLSAETSLDLHLDWDDDAPADVAATCWPRSSPFPRLLQHARDPLSAETSLDLHTAWADDARTDVANSPRAHRPAFGSILAFENAFSENLIFS